MKVFCLILMAAALVVATAALKSTNIDRPTSNCLVCEALVQSVYDSASDAELMDASGFLPKCAEFGLPVELCVSAFTTITGPIREVKDMGVAPQFACSHIGRCADEEPSVVRERASSASTALNPFTRLDLLNGKLCGLCELTIAIIQNYLAASQSQGAIQQTLLAFCAELPSPTNTLCALSVQMYLPKIIHSLEKQTLPNTICAELTLCPLN